MKTIILGTAHLKSTPGKCSPDKKLREYKYSREIVDAIRVYLEAAGYRVFIDIEEEDLRLTQSQELLKRCQIVNDLCKQYKDCIYVSVHVNAAASDGRWHNATGWEIYTSVGKTKADELAACIYNQAKKIITDRKLRTDFTDGDADKEAHLYVLKHTNCPAVLTENFFQDNKDDVEYLTSDVGFHQIVKLHVDGIIDYCSKY